MENFQDITAATGITQEKLNVEVNVVSRLRQLFHEPVPGYAMYGGTALNMVYFGKRQRISYDIDLKCENLKKTEKEFGKVFGHEIKTNKMHRFVDENKIKIDLSGKNVDAEPKKMRAESIPFHFGYGMYYADVLTYAYEILFAEKLLAFANRGVPKDLYDVWVGKDMPFERELLLETLVGMANKAKTDPRIIITRHHHVDTDMGKIDSLVPNLDGKKMYAEVQGFIRELFFEE
ncbi:MAG: nucleotidyl transferase AbiEii/AbiGii toxin family protein [Candidatus Micrarchaeia archaeon]